MIDEDDSGFWDDDTDLEEVPSDLWNVTKPLVHTINGHEFVLERSASGDDATLEDAGIRIDRSGTVERAMITVNVYSCKKCGIKMTAPASEDNLSVDPACVPTCNERIAEQIHDA